MWRPMAERGWWDSVPLAPDTADDERRALVFWSTVGSSPIPLGILGAVLVSQQQVDFIAPTWLAWAVLAYGAVAAFLAPRGGFWLVLLAGALLVSA